MCGLYPSLINKNKIQKKIYILKYKNTLYYIYGISKKFQKKIFKKKFSQYKYFTYSLAYVIFLYLICTKFWIGLFLGGKSPQANMGK